MDDRGSKTYESSKNAIKNLNDYCAKHSNVCRATKKGEYEFYDTKKLSEYEKYLKQSGLKDEIRLVNREKEYKHAQESKKYKEDRSKANREEIKAGEMLAKFNYLQMYQAYISQGGEKNKEAFEKSEGYTFNENKLISDIKNAGINFGGRYKIYDGNTYITSVRTYEDLAKFVGVISKNEIKMATSDIFTQASFRERDKEPVIIDFKGAVWSSQVGEAVTSSMIAKEALSKQPIYGKPVEEKVQTGSKANGDFQERYYKIRNEFEEQKLNTLKGQLEGINVRPEIKAGVDIRPTVESGQAVDEMYNNLGRTFKTYDIYDAASGKATSVKQVATMSESYQTGNSMYNNMKKAVDAVIDFKHGETNNFKLKAGDVKERIVKFVIPNKELNQSQLKAIERIVDYGKLNNVKIEIDIMMK